MEGAAGWPAPRWLPWAGLLMVLAGLAVASYLTAAHYTTPQTLACPETGIVNCAKVTTSSYSVVAGVPLAVLGLAFFAAMLPLQLPAAWRSRRRWLRWGRLLLAGSGILMVFWLVFVELFRLNAICLYCTAVHALTFLLFVQTAVGTALTAED